MKPTLSAKTVEVSAEDFSRNRKSNDIEILLSESGIYLLLFDHNGLLIEEFSTQPEHLVALNFPQSVADLKLTPIPNSPLLSHPRIIDFHFAQVDDLMLPLYPNAAHAFWMIKKREAIKDTSHLKTLTLGVITLDRLWDATFVNTTAATFLKKDENELMGSGWRTLFTPTQHEILKEHIQSRRDIQDAFVFEFTYITPLGRTRFFNLYANYLQKFHHQDSSIELIIIDNTEKHLIESQLIHAATHDGMTQLLHHAAFIEKLNTIETSKLNNGAIIFVDIDNFKSINDIHGHAIGDHIIKVTAQRLVHCFREDDLIARFGGDEFVIFLEMQTAQLDINTVMDKIHRTLMETYSIESEPYEVKCSLGVALFEQTYHEMGKVTKSNLIDRTIENADIAMYHAKKEKQQPWFIYNQNLKVELKSEQQKSHDIDILKNPNSYYFVFQPILKDNKIISVEALLRCDSLTFHNNIEQLFQSLRKHSGRIEILTAIIQKTLHEYNQLCSLIINENDIPNLNLNIEVDFLHSIDSTKRLISLIEESNISAQKIYAEITEEGITHNLNKLTYALSELKSAGLKISLDDFGTGYSSLKRLMLGQFDQIKIDAYFIQSITHEPKNITLLKVVATLAQELNLEFIAEGVEREEELSILKQLNWSMFQGYYFYKPMSAIEIAEIINCHKAK